MKDPHYLSDIEAIAAAKKDMKYFSWQTQDIVNGLLRAIDARNEAILKLGDELVQRDMKIRELMEVIK